MIGLLLALALLQPAPDARTEADRLFTLGQQLIAEGDSTGAVAAWEGALATGWTSAAAEHNLGTVALARGDAPRARLHLERAARLDPLDAAIAQNLRLARERVGEAPPSASDRALASVVGVLTPLGLVGLALAVSFGALGLLMAGRRRLALGLGAVALGTITVAAVAVAEVTRPLAIVMVDEAPVVESPVPSAPGVVVLRAGEAVEAGDPVDGWRPVTLGQTDGWVRADAVAPI